MAMGFRSMFTGDWVTAQSFQSTPEGWLFQAPSPVSSLGVGRSYILSDAQKERAAATLKRLWVWTMAEIVILIVPAVLFFQSDAGTRLLGDPWTKLAVGVVGVLALMLISFALQRLALRPVLAEARPTQLTITMGERVRRQAATMSWPALLILTIAMVVFTGTGVFSAIAAADIAARIGWTLCALVLAALATFQIALLVTKLRHSR